MLTARYAKMLRSVTLDAAYPVSGKDPFYPQTIRTARHAFDVSCLRSVACHRAAPGSAWARLSALAAYLRQHPVTGRTRDPFGDKVTERVTAVKLSEMVNELAPTAVSTASLTPPAARCWTITIRRRCCG